VQVDQQKAVVETRDAAITLAQTKVDTAYTERYAKQAALDSAYAEVDTAYEERGEMQAALEDEEQYLSSLQSDFHFHTQRLGKRNPTNRYTTGSINYNLATDNVA